MSVAEKWFDKYRPFYNLSNLSSNQRGFLLGVAIADKKDKKLSDAEFDEVAEAIKNI